MKHLTGAEIRRLYLDFFKSKDHIIYPSQSLIPVDDNTLLWINSGVATLKKYFDGRLVPDHPRITNSQKSIRTNDIENVGKTPRHHTFFEMLGNFSIGDYFKKEAIAYAWEFLTSPAYMGFDPSLLYVTVYPDDTEAYDYWIEVGVKSTHIFKLEDNYWQIGEGPSGPNTEIFYDRGEHYAKEAPAEEMYPGGENDRYLEVWNLVFSQFNAKDGLERQDYPELPNKNIDTGMGLERMTSVVQNVETNYDTDLFMPIIRQIEYISGETYLKDPKQTPAFRVIADHIRTCVFAISDGALPSNEGRGYIIRRLIRRSVKFARLLGLEDIFMKDLVDSVIEIMEDYYPELDKKRDFVKIILDKEEIRFHETLNDGLAILNEVMESSQTKEIEGATAFKLYDTFGFPIELTIEYAEEAGLRVDIVGFKEELEQQRQRARKARESVDSMQTQNKVLLDITDSSLFIGYDTLLAEGTIQYIIDQDVLLDTATVGDSVQLIFDQTPFYAMSGGQVADIGVIFGETCKLTVTEVTKAPNKQHLHHCKVVEGSISLGDTLTLSVDEKKRELTTRNHTATHLLHHALDSVLGEHVTQAGSYVGPDYLRFDFNHFEPVAERHLKKIEDIINKQIFHNNRVSWQEMPIADAKKLGAKALFSEKYGDVVRVVQTGDSVELCGGCHVNNTIEIGLFKILSESGIGAGIRRIEAVTSFEAYQYFQSHVQQIDFLSQLLKTNPNEVRQKVQYLMLDYKQSVKEIESLQQQLANVTLQDLYKDATNVNGIKLLTTKVYNIEAQPLRNMMDHFKEKLGSALIVIANIADNKVSFMVGATSDLIAKGAHSGKLVKEIATICGGNGGGRPDFAQAGAKDVNQVDTAFKYVTQYIKSL